MFTGKKIAVLCGGDGREREVSLRSGKAVADALNEAGFDAAMIDLKSMDETEKIKGFEGAFIAMHGDWGEGGVLQEKLEKMKIPFTGSGSKASAIAMDKIKACELFKNNGIKIPDGLEWQNNPDEIISKLGHEIVVKPSSGGSTVGITILKDADNQNLAEAVRLAKESYD